MTVTAKVTTSAGPLFDAATEAFYAAASDVLADAQANARASKSHNPKTGTLASTLKMWRRKRKDRPTATIGSRKAPYVTVLERGGGPHAGWRYQGPHVQRALAPRPIKRALANFATHYERHLAGARGYQTATYMEHGPREAGRAVGDIVATR